jgi:CRP/FNR family cyclic AMP-dependent transcriptional regulator
MLKEIPAFSCLDGETMRYFEQVGVRRKFPQNAVLFSKGDESDSLYVVCTGRVKAVFHDEQGKEVVLSIIGPGEYFGEMAAVDGEPRSATIVTKEPTEVLVIRRDDFGKILSSNPDVLFDLLKVLLERFRKADEKIEGLVFGTVYHRVATLLMQVAMPKGQKWVVEEKLTHQEVADTVGSSRETVTRAMKELADAGYISIESKQITINKKLV